VIFQISDKVSFDVKIKPSKIATTTHKHFYDELGQFFKINADLKGH
jgi:hypothetical protein